MAEKVMKVGVKRAKGFLYYIDKQGDVSCAKMARGAKKGGGPKKVAKCGRTPAPVPGRRAASEFAVVRTENRTPGMPPQMPTTRCGHVSHCVFLCSASSALTINAAPNQRGAQQQWYCPRRFRSSRVRYFTRRRH